MNSLQYQDSLAGCSTGLAKLIADVTFQEKETQLINEASSLIADHIKDRRDSNTQLQSLIAELTDYAKELNSVKETANRISSGEFSDYIKSLIAKMDRINQEYYHPETKKETGIPMEIPAELRKKWLDDLEKEMQSRSVKPAFEIVPEPITVTVSGIPVELVPPKGIRAAVLVIETAEEWKPYEGQPQELLKALRVNARCYTAAVELLRLCYPKLDQQYGVENLNPVFFEGLLNEAMKHTT